MVQKRDKKGIDADLGMEIMLVLLRGKKHLRGIAKTLGEPHSTVMRKLNRLSAENALDSDTEGKNKVFFIKRGLQAKNYVFNAERYKLMKLLKAYPEMTVIVDDLLKTVPKGMVILFGSYASFSAKKSSDMDIYIETQSREAKERAESLNSGVSAKIGSFDTGSDLIKEIIRNHVILRGVEEFYEKTGFFG